ncbi:hypothetical protein FN846DRAFT_174628 [Sphaerosporella brunnea]|uniref:Uncharacterized protein n=1 Tax=Sphaerosporella brunnea TaxID=1250544 RepID=A0A5J5EQK5_9PEZI|nr:hypothetical protein FN846DRAFT_174628 [Sphaerosporella brunnea]
MTSHITSYMHEYMLHYTYMTEFICFSFFRCIFLSSGGCNFEALFGTGIFMLVVFFFFFFFFFRFSYLPLYLLPVLGVVHSSSSLYISKGIRFL